MEELNYRKETDLSHISKEIDTKNNRDKISKETKHAFTYHFIF